jgi:hypothetical protein
MLHSEILPEHDCGGDLIELREDDRRMFTSPNVLVVGRNLLSCCRRKSSRLTGVRAKT